MKRFPPKPPSSGPADSPAAADRAPSWEDSLPPRETELEMVTRFSRQLARLSELGRELTQITREKYGLSAVPEPDGAAKRGRSKSGSRSSTEREIDLCLVMKAKMDRRRRQLEQEAEAERVRRATAAERERQARLDEQIKRFLEQSTPKPDRSSIN